jgi:hypothetical protein
MSTPAGNASPRRAAAALSLALAGALWSASGAAAQSAPPAVATGVDSAVVYRREVFHYSATGRPDPFHSLVGSADLGVRVEDLALRGVVYHPDPSRSVAVLAREGVERPVRARVGERVGGIRVLNIRPNSVDVLVEEFGVARRETLQITKATPKGTNP